MFVWPGAGCQSIALGKGHMHCSLVEKAAGLLSLLLFCFDDKAV
jgi:hypothetical protein